MVICSGAPNWSMISFYILKLLQIVFGRVGAKRAFGTARYQRAPIVFTGEKSSGAAAAGLGSAGWRLRSSMCVERRDLGFAALLIGRSQDGWPTASRICADEFVDEAWY